MTSEPIANYGMLSDCRSAALVSAAGSVDWLCFPRFDSPSVFGRILGEDAGFWSIRPVGQHSSTRRYLGPTMVLETVHTTAGGTVAVTDALVLGEGNRGHELGAGAPGTLLRQVACLEGEVAMEVVFAPRPEYGLIMPRLSGTDRRHSGQRRSRRAGLLDLRFPSKSSAMPRGSDWCSAPVTSLGFALYHRHSWQGEPSFWGQEEIARRLEDTLEGWASWSRMHQNYVRSLAGPGRC